MIINQNKIIDLKAKSMRSMNQNSFLIHYLPEDNHENRKNTTNYQNNFNIATGFANIHRNGSKAHGKSRIITWRLNKFKDKDLILQAQKSARGINRPNLTFYICQKTGRNQI